MNKEFEYRTFYCIPDPEWSDEEEEYIDEYYENYKEAVKNRERIEAEIKEASDNECSGDTLYYLMQQRSAFIDIMNMWMPPEGYVEYLQMKEAYEASQPEKRYRVLSNWGEPIETRDGRELFLNKGDILTKSQVDEIVREEQCHLYRRDYFEEFFQEIDSSEENNSGHVYMTKTLLDQIKQSKGQ